MKQIPYFSVIFARDSLSGGIGYKNALPDWNNNDNLINFRNITTYNIHNKKNIIIMGKNTFLSLKNLLSNRIHFVVSKTLKNSFNNNDNVFYFNYLYEALEYCLNFKNSNIFVIGGINILKEAFSYKTLEYIYETIITKDPISNNIKFDTFFNNKIPENFILSQSKVGIDIIFNIYKNIIQSEEIQYLNILKEILEKGEYRNDRTGVGTYSLFSPDTMKFNLTENFPLLTTKRVSLKIIFEELMWFLRGQTDANILKEKDIHIWDGNSSQEYLKKINLDYPEGECGPIYGSQWRNFGGEHDLNIKNHIGEYPFNDKNEKGVDQIKYIMNEIKNNPNSRRLILSAWNPLVLHKVALPSCHIFCQFYVRNNKYLDSKVYMRSNDMFLGCPFNIASYALLTIFIARMNNLTEGILYFTIGDAHIYKNHIEQINKQLNRNLRHFPKLILKKVCNNIEDYSFEDIELINYYPHDIIKAEMAV